MLVDHSVPWCTTQRRFLLLTHFSPSLIWACGPQYQKKSFIVRRPGRRSVQLPLGGSLTSLSSGSMAVTTRCLLSVRPCTGWDRPGLPHSSPPSNQGKIGMWCMGASEAGLWCVVLINFSQPETWASEQLQNSMFCPITGTMCLPVSDTARTPGGPCAILWNGRGTP